MPKLVKHDKESDLCTMLSFEPEAPTRNHEQIIMLSKAKCLIEGRDKVEVEDFKYFSK